MSQILLIPKRVTGSRYCNATLAQHFRQEPRAIGANVDSSFCCWFYPLATPVGTMGIWRGHKATGARIGWSLYYVVTSGRLQLVWGTGGEDPGDVLTLMGATKDAAPLNEWSFLVVNMDRSDRGQVFLNDMTTPIIDADISAEAAVDWGTGNATWYMLSAVATTTVDARISRVGFLVGELLDQTARTELYNNGRGKRFADLSAGLATTFSGQDYWNCSERSGDLLNAATALRPAAGYAGSSATTTIGFAPGPKR